MDANTILTTLRELTDDERLDAREAAQAVVLREVGERPAREAFVGMTVSEYPSYVRRLVASLMGVVFIAAALPSLFRLYDAGRTAHLDITGNLLQARVVGVSTFVLAEFLIITSTLGLSIFAKRLWQRVLFALAIVMGLAVAFVGNWQEVQPDTLFKWLETLAPPLTVVVMSFVGERLIMDGVKKAHADERAYQEAHSAWLTATRDIEKHPKWQVIYGRALVGKLREVNAKGSGKNNRVDFMRGMNRAAWAVAVRREFEIEEGGWMIPQGATEVEHQRPFGSTAPAVGASATTPTMPSVNGHTAPVTN